MVKIWVLSDIHLECYPEKARMIDPPTEFDVLAVAGDIWEAEPELAVAAVERMACGRPSVIVAGNHDFWHVGISEYLDRIREAAAGTSVTFLENETATVEGLRFVGTVLWPDSARDPIGVPDYTSGRPQAGSPFGEPIHDGGALLCHPYWAERHAEQLRTIANAEADVVITHYPPPQSGMTWGGTPPGLWLYGHVHAFDRRIEEGTEFVLNPRQSRVFADRMVISATPAPRRQFGGRP